MYKTIENFENYLIYDDGRCFSIKSNMFLKPIVRSKKKPYLYYKLFDNESKPHRIYVHRLVADAFLPNPNNFTQINHKDEDKSNNCLDNLEWCDCSYNVGYTNNKPICQYSLDDKLISVYSNLRICELYGFTPSIVSQCCNNKYKNSNVYKNFKWKHL